MLALSVQQPFATLIMQGMKRWECRTWSAQIEALKQEDPHWPRFAIHATRQTTMNNLEVWRWLKMRGFLSDCKTFFDLVPLVPKLPFGNPSAKLPFRSPHAQSIVTSISPFMPA